MKRMKKLCVGVFAVLICLALIPGSFLHAQDMEPNRITVYYHDTLSDKVFTDFNQDIRWVYIEGLENVGFTGKSFVDWNTRRDGSGTHFEQNKAVSLLYPATNRSAANEIEGFNEDKTEFHLYAQYIENIDISFTVKDKLIYKDDFPADFSFEFPNLHEFEIYDFDNIQFLGWSTIKNSDTAQYLPGQKITLGDLSEGTDFYAVFDDSEHQLVKNVIYHGRDSEYTVAADKSTIIASFEETGLKPDVYNSEFVVWTTMPNGVGSMVQPADSVNKYFADESGDLHLYPLFDFSLIQSQEYPFHVIYHANGADTGKAIIDDDTYIYASNYPYTQFYLQGQNDLQKDGYKFVGWNTQADGKGVFFNTVNQNVYYDLYEDTALLEDMFKYHENELHLYAVWVNKSDGITITFDSNGGTGEIPAPQVVNKFSEIIIPSHKNLKKGNKIFRYWSTKKDGLSDIYYEKDIMKVEGDTTLYAIYDVANKVTFDLNNPDLENKITFTKNRVYVKGSLIKFPYIDEKECGDYVLLGWSRTLDEKDLVYDDYMMGDEDMLLHAIWMKKADVVVHYECDDLMACPTDVTYKTNDIINIWHISKEDQMKVVNGIPYFFYNWKLILIDKNDVSHEQTAQDSYKIDVEVKKSS